MFLLYLPSIAPSPDDARQALEDELAKPGYFDLGALLRYFWEQLLSQLNLATIEPPSLGWVLPTIIILIVLIIGFFIIRRLRKNLSKGTRHDSAALVDPSIPAETYLAQAKNNYPDAPALSVQAAFRAIVQRDVERGLIEAVPGQTAGEVSRQLEALFPNNSPQIAHVNASFDEATYGHASLVTEVDARAAISLYDELSALSPSSAAGAASSMPIPATMRQGS